MFLEIVVCGGYGGSRMRDGMQDLNENNKKNEKKFFSNDMVFFH
jgi:hypothetical protein